MTTELTVIERAAIALGTPEHEKNLIALSTKYADITAIANQAGREQCHSAYMELKNTRVFIVNAGKTAREDANAFQTAVIAEVARLTAITAGEEARLQNLRDEYDESREREKQAKLAAERERVNGIRAKIDQIRRSSINHALKTSADLRAEADRISQTVIAEAEFGEFTEEAMGARAQTVAHLCELQKAAEDREVEAARLAEERARLERERAEQAERDRLAALARAEEERKAREQREAYEAEQRAAREKAEAAMRAEREQHEARLRAEREAAEAELRRQREEIERQQAEIARAKAEQERVEREAREARESEERRKREVEAAERARRECDAREQAEADARERARREREQFELNGPDAREMIEVLAGHYQVEQETVLNWINRWVWAEVEIAA